ncbi:hypothetical protein C8J56DRAFT_767490 [Mycena floridula]|nr:hypothetical protein C8J56DRAFT_767490 [Mycena floridula]
MAIWANIEDVPGELWKKLVMKWVNLERSYEFVSPNGHALPAAGRPDAIRWWSGRRRPANHVPPDAEKVVEFAEAWWTWWIRVNLNWRTKDAEGKLVAGGTGSWDIFMSAPGVNGIVSIIATLRWWYLAGSRSVTEPAWLQAMNDMLWVLDQINSR